MEPPTPDATPYDRWADAYRRWWGPVIAPAAVALLDRLDGLVPADAAVRMVDIGAGTGTLALAALERWPSARVVAVDPAGRMLDLALAMARERGVADRLEIEVGDAARLPLAAASLDVAVTSFVIQLLPSRIAAVREAFRVLRPGGILACVTWQDDDETFEPDLAFEDAADDVGVRLPDAPGRPQRPYPSPRSAAAELRRAGFASVEARQDWLEHAHTPQGYLDLLEHWVEDDTFAALDDPIRKRLRAAVLRRFAELPPSAFVWRRPLVSVIGTKPVEP